MKKNDKKILDKNTLGDSPAAIYLIDILNHSNNSLDSSVLKRINQFKNIFTQLLNAHDGKHIETGVVRAFVFYKRQDLNLQTQEMTQAGYTPLVINLYKNLVIAELKKFQRRADQINMVEKSASDRARAILRNGKQKFNNQTLNTYGKLEGEQMHVEVVFNQHGLPTVNIDTSLIKDSITSQTLMDKSVKRLTRQGKLPYK